jgi:uncharacterized membrane protein
MTRFFKQKIWHDLFEAGVAIKAINSIWQMLGGVFLLTHLHTWVTRFFIFVSNSQLLGDKDDFLFRLIHSQIEHLNVVSVRTFVGLYLLFHGVMNVFLAYNLFRNRLWAYPTTIAFVSIFLVYQLYRLSHTHSILLLAVSVFDVLFIIVTWHEYRYQKKRRLAGA